MSDIVTLRIELYCSVKSSLLRALELAYLVQLLDDREDEES